MISALHGHVAQRQILLRAQRQNHLPQGFCFVGPEGIGKKLAALQFIAFDFCSNPANANAESMFGCGTCSPCQRLINNSHPDLIALLGDGAPYKIDQIREIQRQMRFRPLYAKRRWVLIDNADLLTEQAQNALLHSLEEPSAETHFILVTSNEELLLPTIRSRTQRIRFGTLPPADVREILQASGVCEQDLTAYTSFANGCPGQVTRWLSEELRELRQDLLQLLCDLPLMKTAHDRNWACLLMSQKLSGHKALRGQINDTIVSFYRDLAFQYLGLAQIDLNGWLVNADFSAQLAKLTHLPFDHILSSYHATQQLRVDFESHVNPELTYNRFFHELTGAAHGQ